MRECKTKRTYDTYTMKLVTICVKTKTSSWSLMKQLEVMLPLQIIQKLSSNEKGMILIKLEDEIHQFIGDVYYISMVKNNILSLR